MGTPDRPLTLLLDTAVVLWIDSEPQRLSLAAAEAIRNSSNRLAVSVVSIWEMEVKMAQGRLPLPKPVSETIDGLVEVYAMSILNLDRNACHQIPKLPNLHKDPFDRLLLCQAIGSQAVLVTPDRELQRYPLQTLW